MSWVGLSKKVDIVLIEESLQMSLNSDSVRENKSEFPFVIDLGYNKCSNGYQCYRKNLHFAKELSLLLGCKTICDGSYHGDDNSPFWCIIWDNGRAYLADDCGSVFGGTEDGGEVEIVRRVHI
ncbi:MAG TPA: hypothetical protein ENK73_03055 [Thiomicrospira sp.]|nr:hypothetical protein [Thiomicrospira sp.]